MKALRALYLLLLFLPFAATTALGQDGRIAFDEPSHDFGVVAEGEVARHVFTFRNAGEAPLVLKDVRASCGCTTPEWSREPVAPGEAGRITVGYDSAGRPGAFRKSITVVTDGDPSVVVLYIRGDVRTAEAAAPVEGRMPGQGTR